MALVLPVLIQRGRAVKALPIINALFEETNPIPVKEALNLLGFNFGEPRLPLIKCSDNLRNKLKALIK